MTGATAAADWLQAEAPRLAEAITDAQFQQRPELAARYGPAGRVKCTQDAMYHLDYLRQAVARTLPTLFIDYISWAKVLLVKLGIPEADLATNLQCVDAVLEREATPDVAALIRSPLKAAIKALPDMPAELASAIDLNAPTAGLARRYLDTLLSGSRHEAVSLIVDAVAAGTSVREIYLGVFQPCLREVGRLWQSNEISVAHEHYCTAVTQLAMGQLYPHIFGAERTGRTLVATCIQGDLHEIGIRMVADFFEMDGWDTHYLGANVPLTSLITTIADKRPDAVAISATITRHVADVALVVDKLRADPANKNLKIVVGGYPFNVAPELAERVGADGHANQADAAVELVQRLCEAP